MRRFSKSAAQAMEWLRKMNIEVKPAIESGEMYEFEYKDILLLITVDTDDNELFISAPVYLTGDTDDDNKDIFETAEHMTHDELKDYIVEYVKGCVSYVGQIYVRPKYVHRLRRYQLLQMLDEIVEIYNTFFAATMIAAAPLEDWLKEEVLGIATTNNIELPIEGDKE